MRILVAVQPTMCRETIAHCIRINRFDNEVRLAAPDSLEGEATSFRPHLLVCNDNAPQVKGGSIPSRVVVRYHDSLDTSVFLNDQAPRLFQDMTIEDLLGVVEEAQRLIA